MIKIYKVDTIGKLKHLIITLHERGAKRLGVSSLYDKEVLSRIWNDFSLLTGKYKGVVIYKENGALSFSSNPFIHYMIKRYEQEGKEYTIIDVKLPKHK